MTYYKASEMPLDNVHDASLCAGRVCVIHSPTEHHMSSWPLVWRSDKAAFERVCQHAVGHPDLDQRDWWEESDQGWQWVHGCCGCCVQ